LSKRAKPSSSPSLRIGHHFDGYVRDVTSAGQGVVAHPSGRVFFVPGVWIGERGTFAVTNLKGRMGHARLIELAETCAQRVAPPCPHHGFDKLSCGGCPWQFVSYNEQLRMKQQRVEQALASQCASGVINPIWESPEELGYRNRTQLKTDGGRLGYVTAGSRTIADVDDCLVLNNHNRDTLRQLRDQLPNAAWKPARGRDWSTLDLDDDIDSSGVGVNERRPFRQGNSAQNERMRAWLQEQLVVMAQSSPVVELFAGSGNFTEVVVQSGCLPVVAVNSFGPAIDSLQSRQLPGVSTRCHDLGRKNAASALTDELASARLLLMDPPRDGLKDIGEYLELARQLRHIIYISCDVATLDRDLRVAQAKGFELQTVQPLDLFPQTPHVELLTVLSRS
jgi:23S rRNA (uracil1939-C5)-methyltransferase